MKTLAAILVEQNRLAVDTISLPALKAGQALVEIHYSGVCHTQLSEVRGHRGHDAFLPHCLGHEGSGTVLEVGPKVEKVKLGDAVILSWMKGTGMNVPGVIYDWNGKSVNAGAVTTFSRHSIISENRLTPISLEFPKKEAALIGCAIPTGLGSVFHTVHPKAGESIAIFGCGGIGLCALLGAKLLGCVPRIAIDINSEKLTLAKSMGATHCIDASQEDPVDAIQQIALLDYAVEASGNPSVMQQALRAVRPQGGAAILIGNARFGQHLTLDPKEFNQGKKLLGTWGGDNQPDIHFPRYCNLIRYGHLELAPFLNQVYSLNEINKALDDLEAGRVLRPLLDMGQA